MMRRKADAPTTLLQKQRKMVKALHTLGAGRWWDHKDLAKLLNKEKLNQGEMIALEVLVETGRIEKRRVDTKIAHISRYEYRVKEKAE